ncbi:MAG: hypothetical protein CMB80_31125 [Flammeovirgaceae bacterium]|nr:hypothetical protein [Flammeovirgaceae bacterium]
MTHFVGTSVQATAKDKDTWLSTDDGICRIFNIMSHTWEQSVSSEIRNQAYESTTAPEDDVYPYWFNPNTPKIIRIRTPDGWRPFLLS